MEQTKRLYIPLLLFPRPPPLEPPSSRPRPIPFDGLPPLSSLPLPLPRPTPGGLRSKVMNEFTKPEEGYKSCTSA